MAPSITMFCLWDWPPCVIVLARARIALHFHSLLRALTTIARPNAKTRASTWIINAIYTHSCNCMGKIWRTLHIHVHAHGRGACMYVHVQRTTALQVQLSRPPEYNDAHCTKFSECLNSNTAMLYMECISRIFVKTYWYSRVKIFCISFLITLWESRSSIYRKPKQDIRSLGRFYNTHLYGDFVKKSIWSSGVLLWLFCF